MKTFTVSDIESIQELLTGEPLCSVALEKNGTVQLLFENAAYGALDELKIMPGGCMLATLLCDAEEEKAHSHVLPCIAGNKQFPN